MKLDMTLFTNEEVKHLRWMEIDTLEDFIISRGKQLVMKREGLKRELPIGMTEPCWECWSIANKLGMA